MPRRFLLLLPIAVAGCVSALPPPDEPGFGGYSFGSARSRIESEMTGEGHMPSLRETGATWYAGDAFGQSADLMFEFRQGALEGGIVDIHDLTAAAWISVNDRLSKEYSDATILPCEHQEMFCRIYCLPGEKLVHLLNANASVHTVRYYGPGRRERCA